MPYPGEILNDVYDKDNHLLRTTAGGGGGGSATVVGVGPVGLNNVSFDTVMYTATSSTVDTFVYKSGGTAGTLKATVTITYTDATKATMQSTVRT